MHIQSNARSLSALIFQKTILLFYFFVLKILASTAQDKVDTADTSFYLPPIFESATIRLNNHIKVRGRIRNINDSILQIYQDKTGYKNISISQIRSVRVRRNGLVKGLGYGAAIGGIVGYGIGYFSYNNDDPYDDDTSGEEASGVLGAAIGLAPGAVVGGIIGGIFTRRHFRIAGQKEKLEKMCKALRRAQK